MSENKTDDKQEKVRIPWDIDLDLTLLEPLLIRCGRCLQKYSLSPRDDQEHLTHLYECPHCHQPLDSRAWLYAVRNLQKLLRQVPSARGDIELDAKRWRKLKACVLLPNRHKHRLTVSDFRSPPLCDLDRELDAISDDAISQYVNSLSSTEKK